MGVIGVDNVGNVDQAPDIMDVYVDYEAPPIALVAPSPNTSKWCRGQVADDQGGHSQDHHDSNGGPMDLVVEVPRNGLPLHDDVWKIEWLWKLSTDPDVLPEDQRIRKSHASEHDETVRRLEHDRRGVR